jgi:hypothetical protein
MQIEIEYEKGDEKQYLLKEFLEDPVSVSDSLSSFGGVETMRVETGKEVRSLLTKISDIEARLDSKEVAFPQSDSITLSDFKLQVGNEGTLKLLYFDEENGAYVGGRLQLDT